MAKLADAHALGACAERHMGSSPVPGTVRVDVLKLSVKMDPLPGPFAFYHQFVPSVHKMPSKSLARVRKLAKPSPAQTVMLNVEKQQINAALSK